MRALHVASSYPMHPGHHTPAPFMEEMLGALAESGHEVTAVVPRVDGLVEGLRSGVQVVGAPYAPRKLQVFGYGRSLGPGNRLGLAAAAVAPLAVASMAVTMRRHIRRLQPDIVHLHWVVPQGLLVGAIPARIPIVISAHGAEARFVSGTLKPVVRRALERADAVVAASSQILDTVAEVYPPTRGKSHVILHGANADIFTPLDKSAARTELGIAPEGSVVVAIGRLVAKKGFQQLIESLSYLTHGARLYIVGEGPERAMLDHVIARSTVGRTQLVGVQSRELVARWLTAADVVAIPSVEVSGDVDSGPVVLMEAMAAGRPVVASRIGMAPDVVNPGVNGYLLDSLNPSEIGAKLTRAINDRDRLGRGAERTFHEVGDWSRVAQALDDVYSTVMEARTAKASG
jgi:glycosyltransferase involved in cell wall biosynthesis